MSMVQSLLRERCSLPSARISGDSAYKAATLAAALLLVLSAALF
jgi:hypothetical protein